MLILLFSLHHQIVFEKYDHDLVIKNDTKKQFYGNDVDFVTNKEGDKYQIRVPGKIDIANSRRIFAIKQNNNKNNLKNKSLKKNLTDDRNKAHKYSNTNLLEINKVIKQEIMLCIDPSIYLNIINN